MVINSHSKIAQILKENTAALDAIVSISPRFEKLRNPVLRKLMAGRTSLSMAAKVAGCTLDEFYKRLEPLGFTIDRKTEPANEKSRGLPAFFTAIGKEDIIDLDVRPVIASGRDPLNLIMEKLKTVKTGQALKIINTFEPVPLVKLLEKKGYITYVDKMAADHYETWFFKAAVKEEENSEKAGSSDDWDKVMARYGNHTETIDVRHLEMPGPMILILETLGKLPADRALFVHHKKIPVFLLPELKEKGYDYRIKEMEEGRVDMLIFRAPS